MKKIDHCYIIDDDPISIFGTKMVLKKTKFLANITTFKNGEDAIRNIKALLEKGERLPSLIFLDLDMPIMDGWQFLEEFAKIPKRYRKYVSVTILSSSVQIIDRERAQNNEMVSQYVAKPMTVEDLKKISDKFLES